MATKEKSYTWRVAPNKEMFQTVFKDSFSLSELLLSQVGKGGGSTLCNPQRGGLQNGNILKTKT